MNAFCRAVRFHANDQRVFLCTSLCVCVCLFFVSVPCCWVCVLSLHVCFLVVLCLCVSDSDQRRCLMRSVMQSGTPDSRLCVLLVISAIVSPCTPCKHTSSVITSRTFPLSPPSKWITNESPCRGTYPVQRSYGISVDERSDQPLVPALTRPMSFVCCGSLKVFMRLCRVCCFDMCKYALLYKCVCVCALVSVLVFLFVFAFALACVFSQEELRRVLPITSLRSAQLTTA